MSGQQQQQQQQQLPATAPQAPGNPTPSPASAALLLHPPPPPATSAPPPPHFWRGRERALAPEGSPPARSPRQTSSLARAPSCPRRSKASPLPSPPPLTQSVLHQILTWRRGGEERGGDGGERRLRAERASAAAGGRVSGLSRALLRPRGRGVAAGEYLRASW